MSKFDTTKKKLQKVWEFVAKNQSDKKDKENQSKLDFFASLIEQQTIKTPIELYSSGNINITPTTPLGSAIKNELVATTCEYSDVINIQVPEEFLPFVKYSVQANSVPNTEVHATTDSDPSTWISDNDIEVRGNGLLIWSGVDLVTAPFNQPVFLTHATDSLLSKGISLSLTKQAWSASLSLNSPTSGVFGMITRFLALEITNPDSCNTNDDTIVFVCDVATVKTHEITSLTSTTISVIGRETITTWTPDGFGGCISNIVINEDVSQSFTFDTLDNYIITLTEPTQSGLGYAKNRIDSQSFNNPGRWLFYSTEKQSIFLTRDTGEPDGDFEEIELDNLPFGSEAGDVVPYSQITLKRNKAPYTAVPELSKYSDRNDGDKVVSFSDREYKNYLKISPSTETIPIYRFTLNGGFIVKSFATVKNSVARTKAQIINQDFLSTGVNEWNAKINEGFSSYLSGGVQSIYFRKETIGGSVVTEFFTDPTNIPGHAITSLNSTAYTAIGDETVTIYPVEGSPVVTKRTNILQTKTFADATTYTLNILDTIDFPVYNDIYTPNEPGDPGVFTYERTTENHTLLSKDIWIADTQDVIVNIKAYLINPLYWKEQRRYIKNDI